jgi:zinc/manganese transport system ATP-binding protein
MTVKKRRYRDCSPRFAYARASAGAVLTTQSLSALYGTRIDVLRVHGRIVIVGGDGAGGCTHPDDAGPAGQARDRHDGHAGHSPEGHRR